MIMTDEWMQPTEQETLDGTESFVGIDATVVDFWRFAMSDLRMNNVRGYLSEFLVARAVGSVQRRTEWDSYDVLSPDGIRIEVKTSGGLQSWSQSKPSKPLFSGLRARTWTPENGYSEPGYNADVYVFCHQTATTHDEYRALDVGQWDFYVLSGKDVAGTGYNSLSLPTVRRMAGDPLSYGDLDAAIKKAASPEVGTD